jgi:hypothetical protein
MADLVEDFKPKMEGYLAMIEQGGSFIRKTQISLKTVFVSLAGSLLKFPQEGEKAYHVKAFGIEEIPSIPFSFSIRLREMDGSLCISKKERKVQFAVSERDRSMWLKSLTAGKDMEKLGTVFVPFQSIQFHNLLGQGAFGKVFSCSFGNLQAACKGVVIPRGNADGLLDFINEAVILMRLKHPALLSFFGISASLGEDVCNSPIANANALDFTLANNSHQAFSGGPALTAFLLNYMASLRHVACGATFLVSSE